MSTVEFPLPDEDRQYLDANRPGWRMVTEPDNDTNGKRGIIVPNYSVPSAYTPGTTALMLMIPADYPMGMIDMFYFCHPGLVRIDGVPIGSLSEEAHFGTRWQRWSRHYPWQPGVDNIITHMEYVGNQLKSEVGE